MYPTSSNNLNYETDNEIYFFTNAFEPLNNFSAHQVKIWDKQFPTVEHAYQWKKFSSQPEIAEAIRKAPSPDAVKRISNAHKQHIPSEWHTQKVEVMTQLLTAKAEQNIDVKEALQRSGKRLIFENSPVDSFWGIGKAKDGQNMLGKLWMELRERII